MAEAVARPSLNNHLDPASTTPGNTGVTRPQTRDAGDPLATRWVVFSVIAVALMMSSLDGTMVATALRAIQISLHTRVNWSVWTITGYSLGRIVTMPIMGKVGDQFGRRKIFLISVVVFTVVSLCCGLATNIYVLVGLRFVQALGGGAFVPSATGIVAQQFGRDRDRAIALFASILPIGGIIGPVFGGLFVAYWSWRGIFLVNVPIGVLVILFSLRLVPESRPGKDSQTDVRGIVLFGGFILLAILGVTLLGNEATPIWSPLFLVPELAALILGVLFVRHAKTHPNPVVPIRYLRGKGFATTNVINVLFGVAALGLGALIPLYAQVRYHVAVVESGTLLTGRAFASVCFAGLVVMLLRRIGYRPPLIGGALATASGLIWLSIAPRGFGTMLWLVLATSVCGIGLGLTNPASNNAGLWLAPNDAGAISGLRGMFRMAGSILGVSVASSVIARSSDPGLAEAHLFLMFAVVVLVTIPFIWHLPDRRGRW